MSSRLVEFGDLALILVDSLDEIDALADSDEDRVLVSGAHAGLGNARRVLRKPPRLAVFNDAGVGKDGAGVAGLALLQQFRIPAAAVDADSARIGDAGDTFDNGVLSHVNELASALGLVAGESVKSALAKLER